MAKKKSAIDEAFSSFTNLASNIPSAVANISGGKQWNEGLPIYGGIAKKNQSVVNPNIISPVQSPDQMTKGLIYKQKFDIAREAQAKLQKPSGFTPKTVQFNESIANRPNAKQLNAVEVIRRANPNLKLTDSDIIQKYNQYGEKLLQGLNNTVKPVKQVEQVKSAIAQAMKQTPVQQPTQQPQQQTQQQPYTFKYEGAIQQASKASGLDATAFHLLRAGENQAENPAAINKNGNGTWDVGLFQINVDPRNTAEVERLKNPAYNAMKAAEIFKSRINLLKDPVLAIASYNLGAGGAVLNPEAAIKRAQWVYYKAGLKMPETEFTKNPLGYVRQNMDYYKQLGLFK